MGTGTVPLVRDARLRPEYEKSPELSFGADGAGMSQRGEGGSSSQLYTSVTTTGTGCAVPSEALRFPGTRSLFNI